MQAVLGRQKGGHGPRRSLLKPRKLGMRVRQPCVVIHSLSVSHKLQNAVFREDSFAKIPVLYAHLTYKRQTNEPYVSSNDEFLAKLEQPL